jgi:hypothetical protein
MKYLNKVTHPVETSVELLAISLLALSHYLKVPLSIDQMIEDKNKKTKTVSFHNPTPPLKIVVNHKLSNNDDVSNEYEIPPHADFTLTTTTDLLTGKSTTVLSVVKPVEDDTLSLSSFDRLAINTFS